MLHFNIKNKFIKNILTKTKRNTTLDASKIKLSLPISQGFTSRLCSLLFSSINLSGVTKCTHHPKKKAASTTMEHQQKKQKKNENCPIGRRTSNDGGKRGRSPKLNLKLQRTTSNAMNQMTDRRQKRCSRRRLEGEEKTSFQNLAEGRPRKPCQNKSGAQSAVPIKVSE